MVGLNDASDEEGDEGGEEGEKARPEDRSPAQRVEVTILGVNKTGIARKEFISTVRYKQNKP